MIFRRISIASGWECLLAKIFGKKVADIRTHGQTIYRYRGAFYVTDWEGKRD